MHTQWTGWVGHIQQSCRALTTMTIQLTFQKKPLVNYYSMLCVVLVIGKPYK